MQLKTSLLIAALLLLAACLHAQDKIYKNNGSIIEAKVSAVNSTTIIYHRLNNPDGPEYTILKTDVAKIVYNNGTTDYFNGSDNTGNSQRPGTKNTQKEYIKKYGDNILTVIPAAFTTDLVYGSVDDPGIGICYERLLDPRGHLSIVMPVMLNFVQNKDFSSNFFYNGLNHNSVDRSYTSVLFMPGVKYYPANHSHSFRYAIGLSFFALLGKEPYSVYDYNYSSSNFSGDQSYALYGLAITNSLNFSVSKSFFMEIGVNSLMPYFDSRVASHNAIDYPDLPFMQFVVKAGYRF